MTQMLTVKQARERLRPPMTQVDLAGKVEVDQTYISLIERGLRVPSDVLKRRLAKALRIRPVRLQFSAHQPDPIGTQSDDKVGHDAPDVSRRTA